MHRTLTCIVPAIILLGAHPSTAVGPDQQDASSVSTADVAANTNCGVIRHAGWFRTITDEEREAVFRAIRTIGPVKVSCHDESRCEFIQIVAAQILDDELRIDLTPLLNLTHLVSTYCYASYFNTPELRPCQLIFFLAAEALDCEFPTESSRLQCVCDLVHLLCYCPHRLGPTDVLMLLYPAFYDSDGIAAVFNHLFGSISVYSVDLWNSPSLAKSIRGLHRLPFLCNLTIRTKNRDDLDPEALQAIRTLRILRHVYVCDLDGNLHADDDDAPAEELDRKASQAN